MHKTDISRYGNSKGKNKNFKGKHIRIFASILKIFWRLLLSWSIISIFTGIIVLASLIIYKSTILGDDIALNIKNYKMSLTSFIYVNDEKGNPQEYQKVHNLENRIWVDFKDIPLNMKNAIIAIEDKRFYEHHGIDIIRTLGATLNVLKGSKSYGGSTLTQQLIKNITEDSQVSLTRKIREILRATELEKKYSKDEILELYLNIVNFGGGCKGVQTAAQLYFEKDIQNCSLAQCACIAAITQNPTAHNPLYHPQNNKERRETVLSEMLAQNKISNDEYNEAIKESQNMNFSEKAKKEKDSSSKNVRNWYVEALVRDIVADLCEKYHIGKSVAENMIYTQGFKIYSAMDLKAQEFAENAIKDNNIMPKDPNMEIGYIMMDYNGRILASLGSRKVKTGNLLYDRANIAKRQPGSTIKPISAYAPIVDLGVYNYSSLIPDEPLQVNTGNGTKNWPVNWYKSYKGKVTLQWAIEKSANAPVAQVVKLLTPLKSYEFLTQKLGITSLDSSDATSLAALATGGTHVGITPREMTAAFQIFGSGGKYTKPFTYFYVTDQNGKVILDNRKQKSIEAVSPTTATIMNRLLRNVIIGPEGTGRAANIPNWNIIGKTGTTSNGLDHWFIGGSPYCIAGIWTGYDNPKRIKDNAAAIRIWKYIMTKYLDGKPVIDYSYDPNIVMEKYCKSTGLLANSGCTNTAIGYYSPSNIPGHCTSHYGSHKSLENSVHSEQNESSSPSDENSDIPQSSSENNEEPQDEEPIEE